MSATHERDVAFVLRELAADEILARAAIVIPTHTASTLVGMVRHLYGTNLTDARNAVAAALEIAAHERDVAKLRAKA